MAAPPPVQPPPPAGTLKAMPSTKSLLARGKAIPWLTWLAIGRQVVQRGHAAWTALTPHERADLQRILRDAHWKPQAVPASDRERLKKHVTKAVRAAASRGH